MQCVWHLSVLVSSKTGLAFPHISSICSRKTFVRKHRDLESARIYCLDKLNVDSAFSTIN